MENSLTLENFLQQRSSKDAELIRHQWEERKERWIKQVNELYNTISSWLNELKNYGKVESTITQRAIFEENIGSYSIDRLTINFVDEQVEFQPIGTNIIGGFGRVDVYGKNGQLRLVLPEWDKWSFYKLDRTDATFPKPTYNLLTKESFKQAMIDLIS